MNQASSTEYMRSSLLVTLQEVLPPNQAMVIHSLITARFFVIEKEGRTGDGLPVLIRYRDSAGTSVSFQVGSVREFGVDTPGSHHSSSN